MCGARNTLTAHLVAREHVDASPEAMVPPAIFEVVAVCSRHGQTVGTISHLAAIGTIRFVGLLWERSRGRTESGAAALTHSMPS